MDWFLDQLVVASYAGTVFFGFIFLVFFGFISACWFFAFLQDVFIYYLERKSRKFKGIK